MHLVLLSVEAREEVLVSRLVPFLLEAARRKRPLLAGQDVEIVVGGVQAAMTLGSERRSEEDEVLGDAGVDDVHGAHGTPGVIEHPFRRDFVRGCRGNAVNVEPDSRVRGDGVGRGEVGEDVGHHRVCVIRIKRDRLFCNGMQFNGVKDIPP